MAYALATAVAIVSAPGAAQTEDAGPADEATRLAARQLAQEGLELLREGRYAEAQDRLHRAYQIVPAPTVLLLEARALEGMGSLVEAAEAYERVRQTKLSEESPEPFRRAVQDAARDLKALTPRIPQITVVLEGIGHETPGFEIRVDGVLLPPALLGAKRPVNPGQHEVVAILNGKVEQREQLTIAAGQHEQVQIRVGAQRSPAAVGESAPAQPTSTANEFPYRPVAWASLGLGGAGLATGAVFFAIMLDKKGTLDDHCTERSGGGRTCPPEYQNDLDTYETARTVSTIGLLVGVAGVGAGVTLLYLAPSDPQGPSNSSVSAWLGPGQVGLRGRF